MLNLVFKHAIDSQIFGLAHYSVMLLTYVFKFRPFFVFLLKIIGFQSSFCLLFFNFLMIASINFLVE